MAVPEGVRTPDLRFTNPFVPTLTSLQKIPSMLRPCRVCTYDRRCSHVIPRVRTTHRRETKCRSEREHGLSRRGEQTAWSSTTRISNGKRRLQTFKRKGEADKFAATTRVEIGEGVHVADSASITVKEAGELWLESGRRANLEVSTIDQYEQHVRLHMVPLIGREKLSKLTVPFLRAFQDRLHNEGRQRSHDQRRHPVTWRRARRRAGEGPRRSQCRTRTQRSSAQGIATTRKPKVESRGRHPAAERDQGIDRRCRRPLASVVHGGGVLGPARFRTQGTCAGMTST